MGHEYEENVKAAEWYFRKAIRDKVDNPKDAIAGFAVSYGYFSILGFKEKAKIALTNLKGMGLEEEEFNEWVERGKNAVGLPSKFDEKD